MQNSIGSNVETLYKLVDGKVEALEFSIREQSPVVGIPLMELKLKRNLLIACINRGGSVITPNGQSTIQRGDTVIVVTTQKGLGDIKDILE
jgi:trk system potassium uptake protein TrkA